MVIVIYPDIMVITITFIITPLEYDCEISSYHGFHYHFHTTQAMIMIYRVIMVITITIDITQSECDISSPSKNLQMSWL